MADTKVAAKKGFSVVKFLGNIIFILFILIILTILFISIQGIRQGEEPSILGHQLFYVSSGSMTPTIPVGSLILVKETDIDGIQVQDVITYMDGGTPVTHRVIALDDGREQFITQGDANEIADPFPVEAEQIIGKVVHHIPFVGYLFPFLKSKHGIFVLSAGLILILYLSYLLKDDKQKVEA